MCMQTDLKFVVKYKITSGVNGSTGEEKTTESYPTEAVAQSHADDISGYEGVEYAVVVPAARA